MPKPTDKVNDYASIAAELGVTKVQLQQFVKRFQRDHDPKAFQPDGLATATKTLKHTFTRRSADRIKAAYLKRQAIHGEPAQ